MALTAPPELPTPTGYIEVNAEFMRSAIVTPGEALALCMWLSQRGHSPDEVSALWVTPLDHTDPHALVERVTVHHEPTGPRIEYRRHRVTLAPSTVGDTDHIVWNLAHRRLDAPRLTVLHAKAEVVHEWVQL